MPSRVTWLSDSPLARTGISFSVGSVAGMKKASEVARTDWCPGLRSRKKAGNVVWVHRYDMPHLNHFPRGGSSSKRSLESTIPISTRRLMARASGPSPRTLGSDFPKPLLLIMFGSSPA